MAIYHLEAKVVSRGTGRSAVAASAYLSCTNILNDYDGVRHDYTRKKGLIWREVFLPEYISHQKVIRCYMQSVTYADQYFEAGSFFPTLNA